APGQQAMQPRGGARRERTGGQKSSCPAPDPCRRWTSELLRLPGPWPGVRVRRPGLRGHKDEEERRGSRGDDQQHDEGVTKRVHAALTHWCRMSCNTIVEIPTSTPMLHAE